MKLQLPNDSKLDLNSLNLSQQKLKKNVFKSVLSDLAGSYGELGYSSSMGANKSSSFSETSSEFLTNLKALALLPKGDSRLLFQRTVQAAWLGLSEMDKIQVLEGMGQSLLDGEFGGVATAVSDSSFIDSVKQIALEIPLQQSTSLLRRDSSLTGPAISWLHSTLAAMQANQTFDQLAARLSNKARAGLGLVLFRKPNRNMLDVNFDYKSFLKFNTFPISFDQVHRGQTVAIIGAGAAGGIAARLLLQAGAKVVIFERDSRIGGRLDARPYHQADGSIAPEVSELGGMRFPKAGRTWLYLLKMLGIQTAPKFPNPGVVPTALYFNNQVIHWNAGESTPDHPLFRKIGADFGAVMSSLLQPIEDARTKHDTQVLQEIFQSYIDKYGQTNFIDALLGCLQQRDIHWGQEEIAAFGALGIGTGGLGALYDVSFVEMLRVMLNKFEEEQYLIPEGSTSALEKLYSSPMQTSNGEFVSVQKNAQINLGVQVTDIRSNRNKPELVVMDSNGQHTVQQFDAVIVTSSPAAMQDMGLGRVSVVTGEAVLAPEVADAIGDLNMVKSSKLFIRTATKFWCNPDGSPRTERRADGSMGYIPQNIQTDQLAHGVYCLDYPNSPHGVVALNYAWGAKSDALIGKTPQQRLDEFKAHISEISPEFAANLIPLNGEIHCVDWQNQQGQYGAFKLNLPGREASQKEVLYQFQDISKGVVLAGDSVSHMGGWVEGALQTGIHAACAVAVHLGGSVVPGSPLELKKSKFDYGASFKKTQPAERTQVLELSASEALNQMAYGHLKATEYIQMVFERAKSHAGLGAVITLNEEAAIKAAQRIDKDRVEGLSLKPLAGLPILVKDNIGTNNLTTTGGTPALRGFVPNRTAPVLQRLLNAGAILVGKANMHELSFGVTSTNLSFAGPVRNPYNRDYIPGGSSGGTASAIAARIVPVGLGTDTGGSTRIPAALTGIVGFRPSVGNGGAERRYSVEGVLPVSSTRDTIGPMGRTVTDVALLDSVISDSELPSVSSLKGLRFGVPRILWDNLDHEVASILNEAKTKLAQAGVKFVEVDIPNLFELNHQVSFPIAMHEASLEIPKYLESNGAEDLRLSHIAGQIASPDVRGAFQVLQQVDHSAAYLDAMTVHRPILRKVYDDYFAENKVDAIFFPTTPVPAVRLDLLNGSSTLSINGGPDENSFAVISRNTEPGSNAGIPGLSIPAGMTSQGLPVGMELDASVGADQKLLGIGRAVEALFGSLNPPKL